MTMFETKSSGDKAQFESGMVRDISVDKPRFDLVMPEGVPYDDQMITRIAWLMARGAVNYGDRNWEQASGPAERARFKESAFRHFMQWYLEEDDEDHAAAIFFNVQGREYVDWRMRRQVLGEEEAEESITTLLTRLENGGSNALEPDEVDQDVRATMLAAGLIQDGYVSEECADSTCCGGECAEDAQESPRVILDENAPGGLFVADLSPYVVVDYPDATVDLDAWNTRHTEEPHHQAARGQTDDEARAIQESLDRD